jgi:hypothetical protein
MRRLTCDNKLIPFDKDDTEMVEGLLAVYIAVVGITR